MRYKWEDKIDWKKVKKHVAALNKDLPFGMRVVGLGIANTLHVEACFEPVTQMRGMRLIDVLDDIEGDARRHKDQEIKDAYDPPNMDVFKTRFHIA